MHEQLTRWWGSISLRTKVTGVTVLLVTLTLIVAGVGTITVLRNNLIEDLNNKVLEARQAVATVRQSAVLNCGIASGPNGYYFALLNPDGSKRCDNLDDESEPETAGLSADKIYELEGAVFGLSDAAHTNQWKVSAALYPAGGGESVYGVVVGLSLADINRTIAQSAVIFFLFGISVVLLGAALTRLLVTSTFAPLREVEASAARFADGDYSQRLGGPPPNTEVGRLTRSLNTMLGRIDTAFKDRARTIDQMRRFVGDASHELRTPLVSLRGYAELYRMGALQKTDDVAQAMERIEKEAIRMGELVEDLLALARLDEAKPLQLAAVDLVPLATDAALDATASAPDRTVSVAIEPPILREPEAAPADDVVATAAEAHPASGPISFAGATLARLRSRRSRTPKGAVATPTLERAEPGIGVIVRAEENKIRQVLTNLVGNAMRFTPAGSPIELTVQLDQPRGLGVISVVDHGEGIPAQIRSKIFERFWRADTSRTRDTGGSGLGLAIVAAIVATHGGTVEVVETPGGGATFRVGLPLLEADRPSTAESDQA